MRKHSVLFVVPPYYRAVYGNAVVKSVTSQSYMVLSLATIAAPALKSGHRAAILDLNLYEDHDAKLAATVKELKPDVVAISATSPIFHIASQYAQKIRQMLPEALLITGGVHPTIFPEDSIRNSQFDIAVFGEGEESFTEILDGKPLAEITGIAWRKGSEVTLNPRRPGFVDIDAMPFPAYELYEVNKYNHPAAVARRNPVASMETSRGCFGQCNYCNMRSVKFRYKSFERIMAEIEYALKTGFREIHFVDDNFAANQKRAKSICEEIIRRKLDMTWQPRGGLRVDTVDAELFALMKRSGVWSIPFGIESGNQSVLDAIKKGIKLDQVRRAVTLAHNAGLRTEGYFMIGLKGETEQTIRDSIAFAKSLDLDLAKFAITIPLPGTPWFDELDRAGLIKTKDWSKYTFSSSPHDIYTHPTLAAGVIDFYYYRAHRAFYFRPRYIARRVLTDIRNGDIFTDIKTFFQTKWFK